jgi:hypothetical protein
LDTQKLFHDKGHIIYANAAYQGADDIGRLMADLRATDPNNMNFEELSQTVARMKNTKEGIAHMSRIMEEIAAEERAEGRAEERGLIAQVFNRIKHGDSKEEIARELSVTMEYINGIARDFGL